MAQGTISTGGIQETLLSRSVAGSSNVTLSAAEAANGLIKLTGALTGSINVVFPTTSGARWVVENLTTGAFTITAKTAAGSGVLVSRNRAQAIYCDGTDIRAAHSEVAQNVATANVLGGIPVFHMFTIADAASGDSDIAITDKTRFFDMLVIKTGGAGAASNTYQLKNGSTAITNAVDGNIADQAVARASTWDDAQWEVAAGGTLRLTWVKSGGNVAAVVYAWGHRVA